MHILVTRPEADAATLAVPLEAMGHRVSLAPMITIDYCAELLELSGSAALIATSRNGLRALTGQGAPLPTRILALPVFVVGPGTAALARSLGFTSVIEGAGTAAGLVPAIVQHQSVEAGPLVHLAGDQLAFDLKGALSCLGYNLRQPIVYRSVAATSLPASVEQDLSRGRIEAVILMSPKSAQTFVNLVKERGLGEKASQCQYICLSAAVAEQLESLQPHGIAVAVQPALDGLLQVVSRLASQVP